MSIPLIIFYAIAFRLWLKQFFDQWKINVMKKKLEFEKVQRVLCEFPVILPGHFNFCDNSAYYLLLFAFISCTIVLFNNEFF